MGERQNGRAAMLGITGCLLHELLGWLQIMLTTCMIETGTFCSKAEGEGEVGDIAGIPWVRYDDPEVKTFKLNAERQNGRAAMLGITGCLLHEILGVDAL